LGLEGAMPDHSTFSKNRYGRFRESDVYRVLFEDVVGQCRNAGLVGGEGFAVDGSLIGGDTRHDRRVESLNAIRENPSPARPVRECLEALDAIIRFITVMRGIFRRPIPPPLGIRRKAAASLVTSITIWLIQIMP
jgi:hypothetical protein